MAGGITMRFKRVAEAFEEAAPINRCPESSGSEHSPDDDLFDRVNSFLESDKSAELLHDKEEENYETGFDLNARDSLRSLLNDDDDHVKGKLLAEIERAYRDIGGSLLPDFKHRLMNQLRERGFDAGLCKSRWGKMGRLPSGNHQYIDVNVEGTRYVIEVFLAGEFEIARPTNSYRALLELLPPIFVGKIEEFKQIVRIMCNAIKISLENMEMHVPPWRRYKYVQAKWLSAYKRTVNEVTNRKPLEYSDQVSTEKIAVGFSPLPITSSYYCRETFVSKGGFRVGHLAMAMAMDGIR